MTLLATLLGFLAIGYLLAQLAYFDLPTLPAFAPVSLLLLTVLELGMAKVIRGKVRGRAAGKPLHPIQIARAAVLSKASSASGTVLAGLYGGLFTWTFARKDTFATAGDDALVAGLSSLTALALVVAALLLERACRTPDGPRVVA